MDNGSGENTGDSTGNQGDVVSEESPQKQSRENDTRGRRHRGEKERKEPLLRTGCTGQRRVASAGEKKRRHGKYLVEMKTGVKRGENTIRNDKVNKLLISTKILQ